MVVNRYTVKDKRMNIALLSIWLANILFLSSVLIFVCKILSPKGQETHLNKEH